MMEVYNVSDEPIVVKGMDQTKRVGVGERKKFGNIRNKDEVARQCKVWMNGRRVYADRLEYSHGVGGPYGLDRGDSEMVSVDDEPEEAGEDEVVEPDAVGLDEHEPSENGHEEPEEVDDEQPDNDVEENSTVNLDDMGYREMQELAGDYDDIPGNLSKDELKARLSEVV